jgi:predicted nuclease with TOPRIM domain
MTPEQERSWLTEKAERLQEELQQLTERLTQLETEQTAD